MIARPNALGPCLIAAIWAAGCGVTRLQTARTVARGQTQTTVATGLVHTSDRGFFLAHGSPFYIPLVPLDIMVRHGATEQLDWGVRLFFGAGALGDVKWNLLSAQRRTALAVSTGFGGAYAGSSVVHVPVTVSVSQTVLPWLTPYAAIGYGTYWIFGYGSRDPSQSYAPRSGTGDGLLSLHAGVELARASGRALLLEYSHGRPLVRDPGDQYEFAVSHFISIGFHTGRTPAFQR